MSSQQIGRVVPTYGRHKQRVAREDPWPFSEGKQRLFESSSSDHSSLQNPSCEKYLASNTRQSSPHCEGKRQPCMSIYDISISSSNSSADSSIHLFKDRSTKKKKDQPPKPERIVPPTTTPCSQESFPNYSDLDKYSLIVSPLVETDQPKLAASFVQPSMPSGARFQNVVEDLSLGSAAGSPCCELMRSDSTSALSPELDISVSDSVVREDSFQDSLLSVFSNGSTPQQTTSPMLLPTPVRGQYLPTDYERVLSTCDQQNPTSFELCLTPRMIKSSVKIGEGTYGDIFITKKNCQGVAFKIVPIEGSQLVNGRVQTTFSGILTEIIISKQLSALRDDPDNTTESFVCVNDVSLVQGAYPMILLEKWDLFKWSQNDRPDYFDIDQLFSVFEFEDGGCAVESFKFKSMKEAKSVLHQVTSALAVAEAALEFEHRDLRVGNILVKRTPEKLIHYMLGGQKYSLKTHGVKVAIIGCSLSRIKQENVSVHTNLGEGGERYLGHGNSEFDVYRRMKVANGDDWTKFTPATNVLWIHYLAHKLSSITFLLTIEKLSRQFKSFQLEALNYYSALNLLRDCPFFCER